MTREVFLRLQEKKGIYLLWEKGWQLEESTNKLLGCVVRKLEKQMLSLNSADGAKGNKIFFQIILRGKLRLHPLLDVAGNMPTEDKENAEVLNTFFMFVFKSKTSYTRSTLLPDLKVSDGEQNRLLMIQGEIDLLLHLDCHKSRVHIQGQMGSN